MSRKNSNKATLSKSILDMKFMQKTKEKIEKQRYQQEGEEYFGNQLNNFPIKKSGRFMTVSSFVICEDLIDGRLSFGGENPEIERLMELEQMEKKQKNEHLNETDISDIQMAKVWKKTTKINVKHERPDDNGSEINEPKRKKAKFLKPKD